MEIRTWENYCSKRVWRFMGGDITRFYCISLIKLLQTSLPTGILDLLITNTLYRHDNLNNMDLNATKSVLGDCS